MRYNSVISEVKNDMGMIFIKLPVNVAYLFKAIKGTS